MPRIVQQGPDQATLWSDCGLRRLPRSLAQPSSSIKLPKVNKEGADSAGRVAGAAVARRRVTEALLLLESLSMKKSGMAQVKVNASGALALSGRVRWQVRALPGWSAAAVTTIQS